MIKSFWRTDVGDRVYTKEAAVDFVCDGLEIDAALYAVYDELPDKDEPVIDCLHLVRGSNSISQNVMQTALSESSILSEDAKKSIERRNKTTGIFKNVTYGMSVISGNHVYVDDNEEVKNHSLRPEYLIVFSGNKEILSVDKIEIATSFLDSVIKTLVEIEEVNSHRELEFICQDLERELGENPVRTRDEFERKYISLLAEHFYIGLSAMGTTPSCLRLFRPSSNSLQKIFSTVDTDEQGSVPNHINICDKNSAAAIAFRTDETISLWSLSKLTRRESLIEAGYIKSTQEFRYQQTVVGKIKNLVSMVGCSTIAMPIRINDIIVGTLEISSPSRSDLMSYIESCEQFAMQCGEFYRRLELANDRGWLVRMHFLHAARHRLQHIVSRISEKSEELGGELGDLIADSVVNEPGASSQSDILNSTECKNLLDQKTNEAFVKHHGSHASALKELFVELQEVQKVSRRNFILLTEIVEALAANVRKHGFQPAGLKVFAGARCGNVKTIVLTYRPKDTYEQSERANQVGVSPMPSSAGTENGYSYGLFLLATQIRMSGGWMMSHADEPDAFGQTEFGFTIILNASIREDGHFVTEATNE
ncbi:hypothetical protein [Hirschia maritima]|uniref:hypothetical protein n=1 Tax=Hirschia maritima TaxID=1121961 RepID=UPI0014614F48|nr:hypothetical protein [Hirschia maritima]